MISQSLNRVVFQFTLPPAHLNLVLNSNLQTNKERILYFELKPGKFLSAMIFYDESLFWNRLKRSFNLRWQNLRKYFVPWRNAISSRIMN
jgi:hypothetical protein